MRVSLVNAALRPLASSASTLKSSMARTSGVMFTEQPNLFDLRAAAAKDGAKPKAPKDAGAAKPADKKDGKKDAAKDKGGAKKK